MMFSAFCPTHDARVLMTRRNVTDFTNTAEGPALRWRCNCGHEGTLDRRGSIADAVAPTHPQLPVPVGAHSHG